MNVPMFKPSEAPLGMPSSFERLSGGSIPGTQVNSSGETPLGLPTNNHAKPAPAAPATNDAKPLGLPTMNLDPTRLLHRGHTEDHGEECRCAVCMVRRNGLLKDNYLPGIIGG